MSRTDDYPTPKYLADWAVEKALSHFSPYYVDKIKFLEPGCGVNHPFYNAAVNKGCIATGVDNRGRKSTIIDKRNKKSKIFKGVDFVDEWKTRTKFDVICTNPPFSRAEEFVRKSFSLLNDPGVMMLLLKLPFLCSKERISLWRDISLHSLYVIQKRPSFSGDGKTDATEYGFYLWKKPLVQHFNHDVCLNFLNNMRIPGYPFSSKEK